MIVLIYNKNIIYVYENNFNREYQVNKQKLMNKWQKQEIGFLFNKLKIKNE